MSGKKVKQQRELIAKLRKQVQDLEEDNYKIRKAADDMLKLAERYALRRYHWAKLWKRLAIKRGQR